MRWLYKLERKFGNLAIKNLMLYIVVLNLGAFVLIKNDFSFYNKLVLIPSLVLHGEVWRLITFIFIPQTFSMVFVAITLYFYYLVGSGLEQEWGTFKFNIYYFIGVVATIIAAFITDSPAVPIYLNLSLFLAFARIYPDFEVLLFFILPVKVKYLAYIVWAIFIFTLIAGTFSAMMLVIAAIVNYFLFFGKDIVQNSKHRRHVHKNKSTFRSKARIPNNEPFHKCTVCGITDQDDPEMDFRYCVECNGHYGYCSEHLHNHEHIK